MKSSILLLTLFFSTLQAPARIGETLEQCRVRYGPERDDLLAKAKFFDPSQAAKCKMFVKNGFSLLFTFDQGKAVRVHIQKTEAPLDMTEDEKTQLLQVNGGGKKWIIEPGLVETEDHAYKAYGLGSRNSNFLAVLSMAYEKRRQSEKAAADQKKLEGF